MADDKSNHRPIIIKKKKHGEHGHHGGAWKVAYADFVTAMMAFFLLLWLLNVTTDEQKRGISQYFTPESVSRSTSGSGGVLGGISLAPGSLPHSTASTVIAVATPVPINTTKPNDETSDVEPEEDVEDQHERARDPSDQPQKPRDISDRENLAGNGPDAADKAGKGPDAADKAGKGKSENPREANEQELAKALELREEQSFKKVEEDLRAKIQQNVELRALVQNLLIDRTEEGLRIQIVDQVKTSMFPSGSSVPYDYAKKLLGLVTQAVLAMPNHVAVTGHTDANQFSRTNTYSNWELSTDRANSSRRAMMEFGLPAERLARVVGKADREPLLANEPNDPRNRRISIVLIHANSPTDGAPAAPATRP